MREFGAFIMEADEHRLALIERFGVKALRNQLAENRDAYRRETRRWQHQQARQTMQEALRLAARRPPPPSLRIVLYAPHRRAVADLGKLGIPVEYATPNASGDGASSQDYLRSSTRDAPPPASPP
jgi:hypothetical protein